MPSSVSSASSTASSQKRQSDAIVSLNLLLRSTPLPTVSSLQEITPSLLVDLYEVLFLVKLPYSTPRDLSPESQLRNIRILIGTIAHNVLQMDLSFIDPRKICDGDERALLEFLKIFIGVANLRRIYPAGARNVNHGSIRQISGAGASGASGGSGGNAARPKISVAANSTTQHLTIAVKDDKLVNDIDVRQHEVDGSEVRTAASTAGSEVYDDNRSEEVCSPGRSDIAYHRTNGIRGDVMEEREEEEEERSVNSFVEETVTATLDNKGLEEDVAEGNGQTHDEPGETDRTMMTIASEATSIAPDVLAQLNERVALQAARIQNLGRTENRTETPDHSMDNREEEQTPRKEPSKPAIETPGLSETPKPPQIRSPQPESTPLPDSQSSSDEGSVRLIIEDDQSEGKKELQSHDNDAQRREDEDGEDTEEEEAITSLSTRSPSLKSQPKRSFTASPSKMDPRYLSPEKPGIIAFDTSPSATMAYKAELRASFSEDLQRGSEASSFAWDPTPPDVQTQPLMEFNSFYSTANTTAEQTTAIRGDDEAAVSLDFAAMANGLRIFHGRDERSDDEAIEDDLTVDERNEQDESVIDEREEKDDRQRIDDTYEESEQAEESYMDETQGDFEPIEEKEKDLAKATVPVKSLIPVPAKQGKPTTGTQSRNPSDKKELLRFFSGQRPLVYRKSFQKASPSPVTKPSTSKLPTRVHGQSSTRSTSPEKGVNQADATHEDEQHESILDEEDRNHESIVNLEDEEHESVTDPAENEYDSVIDAEEKEHPVVKEHENTVGHTTLGGDHHKDEERKVPSFEPPSSPIELIQDEDLEPPQDGAKPSTPILSPEDTISASVMPDSSPTPMPRSRPTTATRPTANASTTISGILPSLTTVFGPQSPEISALPPTPDDPTTAEDEIERIPSSPSSIATSEMSVSTVGWVDSPHTAALKRKRREAMAAMHEGMDVKVGSKIAKLAIDYGSWSPRASPAVSRTASSMRRHDGLGVASEGDDDHDMGSSHVHAQLHVSDDDEDDDENNNGDEYAEEDIMRLEEELRVLSEISKRESEKQTSLFRMLMRSRHVYEIRPQRNMY